MAWCSFHPHASYSHDQLTVELGMQTGSQSVTAAAAAAFSITPTPAQALAAETCRPVSSAQLQHDVLYCLMGSNETALDAAPASLLGGVGGLFSAFGTPVDEDCYRDIGYPAQHQQSGSNLFPRSTHIRRGGVGALWRHALRAGDGAAQWL